MSLSLVRQNMHFLTKKQNASFGYPKVLLKLISTKTLILFSIVRCQMIASAYSRKTLVDDEINYTLF